MKNKIVVMFIFVLAVILVACKKVSYEAKFVDWDDSVIDTINFGKNKPIIAPTDPTREGYNFVGWDKDFKDATTSLVIHAKYEPNIYKVIFKGYLGEVLKEEEVQYGQDATPPLITNPSSETFLRWDKSYTIVMSDLTINAVFEKNSYEVKFFDPDGKLLITENVEHGKDAIAPVLETSEGTTYKWDKSYTNIQENLEVRAIISEIEYSIIYYDDSTELKFDVSSYKKDDVVTLPIPTKDGYEFSGWFLSNISLYEIVEINNNVSGNLVLYSRWVKTKKDELVSPTGAIELADINKKAHSSGTGFVYQPKFPVGAKSISVLAYKWESSNTKVATISAYSSISVVSSGYAIITATLNSDPNYILYVVICTSSDGVRKATIEEANSTSYVYATFIINEAIRVKKIVSKGGYVIPPTAAEKPGYTFVGWEGESGETIYNITKDTTFVAQYTEGKKSYAGKTVSILGDSISTYVGYIPNGFDHFYPYPTADLGDVNQTWWMQFINHYGMKLLVNNSWSGSAVAGEASSAGQNMTRLDYLFINDVIPDVIVIFMGANDAPSPYINLNQFDYAYGKMIENIKKKAPASEIIICTLPSIPLYSAQAQADYNMVIKKHANNNDFTIIDFEQAFTLQDSSKYLVDSAHPNKEGMNLLAEVIINELYNKIIK